MVGRKREGRMRFTTMIKSHFPSLVFAARQLGSQRAFGPNHRSLPCNGPGKTFVPPNGRQVSQELVLQFEVVKTPSFAI